MSVPLCMFAGMCACVYICLCYVFYCLCAQWCAHVLLSVRVNAHMLSHVNPLTFNKLYFNEQHKLKGVN